MPTRPRRYAHSPTVTRASAGLIHSPRETDAFIDETQRPRAAHDPPGRCQGRTVALNQLHSLVATAPQPLREHLTGLSAAALLYACTALTIDPTGLADPVEATKAAPGALAARVNPLTAEIKVLDRRLAPIVATAAPRTRAYVQRRTTQGLSKQEIIRCLKRYIVREVYTRPARRLHRPEHLTSIGASGWSAALTLGG